jgi:2-polyprenyl-3-methyl-5-hydroxy-6-metoxy-1,4-benzoquinol methylase
MAYDHAYFQNQIAKSDDKVAWQYGSLVAYAQLDRRPTLRVLDAGCGAGPGLRYLATRGFRAFGADLVEYPLTVARQLVPGARVVQSDLAKPFPYAPASFDLVLLSEVIEHLENTGGLLAECYRVLASGGALVATTPNLWDVRKFWQRERWSGYVDKTHRRLFDGRSLAGEFRAAGLAGVHVRSGFKPMLWVSSRALHVRFAVPWPPFIGNTLIAVGYKFASESPPPYQL